MPFVQRNETGEVTGIAQSSQDNFLEELPIDHPDVLAFLHTADGAAATLVELSQSDTAMARVIEDLIELLIMKGTISFEDLPPAAQAKLSRRQEWRGTLEEALESFGGGKVI